MLAESVRKQVVEEGLEAEEKLEKVIEVLKEGARKARDLSRKLVPTSLQEETIARALQELCNQYHDPSGLQCDFEGDLEEELPRRQETAIHLYRIAQEALMNAQKHGEATRVEVVLGREGGALQLTVRDDGVGVPEDLRKEPRKNVYGVGLSSMQHRAHLIGGSLRIGAEEAWPTVVTCRLPLTEARRE
jgi:signal transduction histidine kinase